MFTCTPPILCACLMVPVCQSRVLQHHSKALQHVPHLAPYAWL